MWVRFNKAGEAAWFGPAWVNGAAWVEGVDDETLIACRRTDAGEWVTRDPVVVAEPTQEEIEARKRAQYDDAVAERTEALRAALMADPMYLDWQMGLVERTVWAVRAMEISANIPEPVME